MQKINHIGKAQHDLNTGGHYQSRT